MTDEEIFDVCDEHDVVVGQAPRAVVHAQNLLHRAVHIWVLNSAGEMLLQLRSQTKDQYPGCYTSSASGHLDSGEDYETAAVRELQEELGLTGALEFVGKLPASPETAFEHTVLYRLTTDVPAQPNKDEIAGLEVLPVPEIRQRLKLKPELFSPPLISLLEAFATTPDFT
ncbi:MAG: NUDIX domain-containing protein [Planctomycetaceae bacterium]